METRIKIPKKKYKCFDTTFSLCSFALVCSLLYPTMGTRIKRALIITGILVFNGVQAISFIAYTYKCLVNSDFINLTRNVIMSITLVLYILKTYYGIYVTEELALLLQKISHDLLKANNMEQKYQDLYDEYIKRGKVGAIVLLILPTTISVLWPGYAGILTSIESIQTDDFKRHMVYEMNFLYIEDIQNEAPLFHLIFVYNMMQAALIVPNFCGFDGTFCIATTHLRLKLKLMILRAQDAFESARNCTELRKKMHIIIGEHQNALQLHFDINSVYGTWLLLIFVVTTFFVSCNLYQLQRLGGLEPRFIFFLIFSIVHIYVPCYYASELYQAGEDTSDELYCLPWERWADRTVTRQLIFMIARAQRPLLLSGNGLVIYNMQLFKAIIQTSYSFFTLISA